jgi:hypothetical protein
MFVLWAIFHIAIGAYHTVLFSTQGSGSLYSSAYGIPVSPADMQDPARALGSDAIEVYSVLLAGYGVLAIWGTILALRGQYLGWWLNTILLGVAGLAYVYGLIVPGQLTAGNAYAGPVLYALGVVFMWAGFSRLPANRGSVQ